MQRQLLKSFKDGIKGTLTEELSRLSNGQMPQIVNGVDGLVQPNAPASRATADAQLFGKARGLDRFASKAEASQPRKEVMNASRWIAPVVTNAAGKATITIPLPDNTTEWRLTSRGCTVDTLVGQATASLITRKDFFLELKTPVLTQEGDTMQFLAKLHNLTGFEGAVNNGKMAFKCCPNEGCIPIFIICVWVGACL